MKHITLTPALRSDDRKQRPGRSGRLAEIPDRFNDRAQSVAARSDRPLAVDLDGTLIRSDLLIETAFAHLGRRPQAILGMLGALREGKAALKHLLSEPDRFEPETLPYDEAVLERIREARAQGRKIYLASASHERLVKPVADHLGLFDGWFASNADSNCGGAVKARKLVEAFGEGGFDYIGNDKADLLVWEKAHGCIAIRAPSRVKRKLDASGGAEHLHCEKPTWRDWAKLVRVHQYAKNALLFVPMLTSHAFEATAFLQVLFAAIAFSLCASSVYILNDLVDLNDDRAHRTKCNRPLANGAVPLLHALVAIPLLLGAALLLAGLLSLPFLAVLIGYYLLTTAYSFFLKRVAIVDVLTLAALYTIRVVAGAVVIGVPVSAWLLAFSMALFLSLALVKRYVELSARLEARLPDSSSRGYENKDASLVMALAAAAGFNAVTVFTLYASSDDVDALYSRPEMLWLAAPVFAYWIARMLMLAHRGVMNDDPVVFALRDRVSQGCAALIVAIVLTGV